MFKASVRKSISLVVVTVILLGSMLLAGCQPYSEEGLIIEWDYSYVLGSCNLPPIESFSSFPMVWYSMPDEYEEYFDTTVGLFIEELLSLKDPESDFTCPGMPTDIVLYMSDSHGTRVVPNDYTLDFLTGVTEYTKLYFGPAPKNGEIVRLTLFGYVFDDGGSCVLWSLDGSPNAQPNEKCGSEVELVCTVRLVEKELKPDCKDGYDWLGFNIAHDSQWLSWAEKFASKNGRP